MTLQLILPSFHERIECVHPKSFARVKLLNIKKLFEQIRAPLSLEKMFVYYHQHQKYYLKSWGGRVTFFVAVAWWLRARALESNHLG